MYVYVLFSYKAYPCGNSLQTDGAAQFLVPRRWKIFMNALGFAGEERQGERLQLPQVQHGLHLQIHTTQSPGPAPSWSWTWTLMFTTVGLLVRERMYVKEHQQNERIKAKIIRTCHRLSYLLHVGIECVAFFFRWSLQQKQTLILEAHKA